MRESKWSVLAVEVQGRGVMANSVEVEQRVQSAVQPPHPLRHLLIRGVGVDDGGQRRNVPGEPLRQEQVASAAVHLPYMHPPHARRVSSAICRPNTHVAAMGMVGAYRLRPMGSVDVHRSDNHSIRRLSMSEGIEQGPLLVMARYDRLGGIEIRGGPYASRCPIFPAYMKLALAQYSYTLRIGGIVMIVSSVILAAYSIAGFQ